MSEETISGAKETYSYKLEEVLSVFLRFGGGSGHTLVNEGKAEDGNVAAGSWGRRRDGRRYLHGAQASVPYHPTMAIEDPTRHGYRDHFSGGLAFRYQDVGGVSEYLVKRDGRFGLYMHEGSLTFSASSHVYEVSDETVKFPGYGQAAAVSIDHGDVSLDTALLKDGEGTDWGQSFVEGADYVLDDSHGKLWPICGGDLELNRSYYMDYFYNEGEFVETMDFQPHEVVPGEWHRVWFNVRPGLMELKFDDNDIYSGGWFPGNRSYRYNHHDPETRLDISCSGDLDQLYLFGWESEPFYTRQAGKWKSEVIDFGADGAGEDVWQTVKYIKPKLFMNPYEHAVTLEVRFANDPEELPYHPPLKWSLEKASEVLYPDDDDPLYYGRYMRITVNFKVMDYDRPLPKLYSLEVETYRPASPPLPDWQTIYLDPNYYFTGDEKMALTLILDGSTTPLAAGETFTGSSQEISTDALYITGSCYADQDGTLKVQQSPYGDHWDAESVREYKAEEKLGFKIDVVHKYFRVVYDNGDADQSVFRLHVRTLQA